jgi:hypothetical protein
MTEQRIYLNGINALTGQYLALPLSLADAAALARGTPPDRERVGWFRRLLDRFRGRFFGLPMETDPRDVAGAGWAVVFGADTPADVRAALQPLIDHRGRQVPPDRCKVLEYRPGQSREDWLRQYGARGADVEPTRVPYYLLLVGGPASIPFEFQYLLDIDYAVGRLAFDRPEQYAQYASSVVAYETAPAVPNGREVVFWGTRHDNDPATAMSADYLVRPLYAGLPAAEGNAPQPAVAERLRFRSRCFKPDDSTRANLAEVLHGRGPQAPPALLFTASHGMGGWPKGDPRQRPAQGALLCQDWSGFGSMLPEHYFAAADVADDARVHGLVAFHFACYGAGTPAFDNFLFDRNQGPVAIADAPFVAALPQRLLSHPQGGALAVVGHVERAWGYSIQPPGLGPQLIPFRNFIGRVLGGEPVGHATQDFSQRFATFSTELLDQLDSTRPGARPSDADLVWSWIERNDAQNYVVLGDPAVRLRSDVLQ